MRDGDEPVKAPAKEIPDTNGQAEINQSQHKKTLVNSPPSTGANPKRAISSVKHLRSFFLGHLLGTRFGRALRLDLLGPKKQPARRCAIPS